MSDERALGVGSTGACGPLVIIGGHEDRRGDRVILRQVADLLRGRPLLVCAAASRFPQGYVDLYRVAFADLGIEVHELTPESAASGAGGVFFSGGDQNRLSEAVRGSRSEFVVRSIWEAGGVIAGTSAGASVMSDTMLTGGASDSTPQHHDIELAPGLGLLEGVLIDQHFAERGRIGRLASAVREHPALLGVGIDEDTAIVVEGNRLRVIGSGGVYMLDGGDSAPAGGMCLRVLSDGDGFDLVSRQPIEVHDLFGV